MRKMKSNRYKSLWAWYWNSLSSLHLKRTRSFWHWLVDMMLTHSWLDSDKFIHFVNRFLILLISSQGLIGGLLPRHVCHNHSFGRVSRICWRFDTSLFLLNICITIKLIIFCNVPVGATYHCSYRSWWLVRHPKWVCTFWIKRHLNL